MLLWPNESLKNGFFSALIHPPATILHLFSSFSQVDCAPTAYSRMSFSRVSVDLEAGRHEANATRTPSFTPSVSLARSSVKVEQHAQTSTVELNDKHLDLGASKGEPASVVAEQQQTASRNDSGLEAWPVVLGGFCCLFVSFGWVNGKCDVPTVAVKSCPSLPQVPYIPLRLDRS